MHHNFLSLVMFNRTKNMFIFKNNKCCMSIFSETVCDKETTFLRNCSSDNIESNTKKLSIENETRLPLKIVYGV